MSVRACRLSAVVVPGRVRNIHVVTTRRAARPLPPLPFRQSLARLPVGRVGLGSGGSVGGKTFHVRSIGSGRGRGKRAAVPYPRRQTGGFPVGPAAQVDQFGERWHWPTAFPWSSGGARSRWRYRSTCGCGSSTFLLLRLEGGESSPQHAQTPGGPAVVFPRPPRGNYSSGTCPLLGRRPA